MFGSALVPSTDAKELLAASTDGKALELLEATLSIDRQVGNSASWSLLDLTTPIRSQVFLNLVGDLLCYSGVNEVNTLVYIVRCVCRELCDQIDEECLTFNYDDTLSLPAREMSEESEINLVNRAVRRHPRLKFFECIMHSKSKLDVLLKNCELPPLTWCSFVFEFKVSHAQIKSLVQQFRVRRLNIIPDNSWECLSSAPEMREMPGLRTLCLRSCKEAIVKSFMLASPHLQGLHIVDCPLTGNLRVNRGCLTFLNLSGITTLADDDFGQLIKSCENLKSLYISKCHISYISIALPRLELLSVTHCRQLIDQCATDMLQPCNNPSLRFVDFTENRGLVSPALAHPGLEIAWLMHCTGLRDQAVTHLFQHCPSLSAVNLVQSSIENALISGPALRTLEFATSQKLTDLAVTNLLQHCPSLTFLDVGHCCQLLQPVFTHASLETILLSFCVNLREAAIVGLFANCPALKYVELAVCMFDMTKFQREYGTSCRIIVNFDF